MDRSQINHKQEQETGFYSTQIVKSTSNQKFRPQGNWATSQLWPPSKPLNVKVQGPFGGWNQHGGPPLQVWGRPSSWWSWTPPMGIGHIGENFCFGPIKVAWYPWVPSTFGPWGPPIAPTARRPQDPKLPKRPIGAKKPQTSRKGQ
ncbi:hypothetical protein O181_122652 [Austropuccinia psidii MF-1]|uniref:Uncharacterized protein n=1 Tax=Austropuccinia psidii MF-1 TaxID=1389203 RepID=A0A9Q3Q4M5_9BASI|nr:hypothetical protein [Austropuccinia psidii MF-1]